MNKTKLIIITVTIVIVMIILMGDRSQEGSLISPHPPTSTPVPTPDAPKTFKFDSSTDLKAELEKVDPKVLDSDFE